MPTRGVLSGLAVTVFLSVLTGCRAPESTGSEVTFEEAFFRRLSNRDAPEAVAERSDAQIRYLLGTSVDDRTERVGWLRLAAEQGHSDAQFFLGAHYEDGDGVPQDYVEAHKWYNLATAGASDHDREEAARLRDSMARKLTPNQLGEAQRRAREWHESH